MLDRIKILYSGSTLKLEHIILVQDAVIENVKIIPSQSQYQL